MKDLVLENRRITIHEVANLLGISVDSVHTSLKDNLNVHHIAMKSVSRTCSLYFFCMWISGYKEYDSTPSLVTWFSAVWLPCFSKTTDGIKGKDVYHHHHHHRWQEWHYNPYRTLASSRIPFHSSLYVASILQFLTSAFSCPVSTSYPLVTLQSAWLRKYFLNTLWKSDLVFLFQVLWSCCLASNLPVLQCLCSNTKAEDVSRKQGVAAEVYKVCLQVRYGSTCRNTCEEFNINP